MDALYGCKVQLESAKTPWHDVDILSYQSVDNASMAFHEVSHFYLSTRRAQETHCSESPRFPYFHTLGHKKITTRLRVGIYLCRSILTVQ